MSTYHYFISLQFLFHLLVTEQLFASDEQKLRSKM